MSKFDPVDYALHYGPRCRDCAERDGTCDNGAPCDPDQFRAVVEHTLKAWTYGIKHGFMDNPFAPPAPAEAKVDAVGEETVEAAAMAAFRQAQSVYRADHDHFPLKSTWQTTDESVREGWRKIAAAALSEGRLNASKLNEKDIATAVAPYLEEDFTAWDVASAVLRLLLVSSRSLSQEGEKK